MSCLCYRKSTEKGEKKSTKSQKCPEKMLQTKTSPPREPQKSQKQSEEQTRKPTSKPPTLNFLAASSKPPPPKRKRHLRKQRQPDAEKKDPKGLLLGVGRFVKKKKKEGLRTAQQYGYGDSWWTTQAIQTDSKFRCWMLYRRVKNNNAKTSRNVENVESFSRLQGAL